MSRAQLKKVFLDVDFFSNPKIEALGYKFGSASQACLIEILCAMSRATNAQVDEDLIYSKIHKHQLQEPSNFFNYLVEKNIIFKDGDGFSNGPVIKDQENYARKLEASNARVTRFREKKEALSSGVETRTPDIDFDYDNVTDIDLDIKLKELDTPEIRSEVRAFVAKVGRDSYGRNKVHQQTFDSWQSEYQGRPEDFLADLKFSNGLTKCVNLKRRDQQQSRASPKQSAAERNLESTKEALRQIKEEIEL